MVLDVVGKLQGGGEERGGEGRGGKEEGGGCHYTVVITDRSHCTVHECVWLLLQADLSNVHIIQ